MIAWRVEASALPSTLRIQYPSSESIASAARKLEPRLSAPFAWPKTEHPTSTSKTKTTFKFFLNTFLKREEFVRSVYRAKSIPLQGSQLMWSTISSDRGTSQNREP